MEPLQAYQQDLMQNLITPDSAQEAVVLRLQHWYQQWQKIHKPARPYLKWLRSSPSLHGIYLWGSVGIGKTYLLDLVFQQLPTTRKMRLHFHHFMEHVHRDLRRFQGVRNPLQKVAQAFHRQTDVLFIDEFMVHDIADAMILSELLSALTTLGICILTTSNLPPDDLYRNGLQRQRFLPAISLLKSHCEVIACESNNDYRRAFLQQSGLYFTPLNDKSRRDMQQCFERLVPHPAEPTKTVWILERPIEAEGIGRHIVWFTFSALCAPPRSQRDYLELSSLFNTIMLSEVPQLRSGEQARYFMNLVDIAYDQKVRLVISAAVPIAELYPQGPMKAEFARIQSRLHEMQSWL